MKQNPFAKRVIEAAGGMAELARKLAPILGITEDRAYWRVQRWVYNGIPERHALTMERLSGVDAREILLNGQPPDSAA